MRNSRLYRVPPYQRDYGWTEDQLEDLWEDLIEVWREDTIHYLGYIVLQEIDKSKESIVIDGQQRLASLSILVLVITAKLRELGHLDHAAALEAAFIFSEDLVTLNKRKKLKLNRNDDDLYRKMCGGENLPQRKLNPSNRKLNRTFSFFQEKVQNLINEKGAKDPKELLPKFIEVFGNNLAFTVVNVDNDLAAFRVFETLNARGAQLSVPDLLKNFLFSKYFGYEDRPHPGEYSEIEENWQFINDQLGDKSLGDFLVAEWNSRHGLVRRKKLFREIRKEVDSHDDAKEYLDILQRQCEVYPALLDGGDEFWRKFHNTNISEDLNALALYSIKQPHALFLAAWMKWGGSKRGDSDFVKLVNWVTNFSIRYNVVGRRSPPEQERLYDSLCASVREGKALLEIKSKLLSLYPADDIFTRDFANISFPASNSKKVRYILSKLEETISGRSCNSIDLTLEHILPQKPGEAWVEYFGNDWEDYVNRLGNITLIEKGKNPGQEPYAEKKKILGTSYELNTRLQSWDSWDKEAIEARQMKMAKVACSCWRIG